MLADDVVRALLMVGRQAAVGEMIAGKALVTEDAGAFKMVRERRGSLPMWTSLGAKSEAALTELLYANSTWGICTSQLFWSSLSSIASIWAIVSFTRSTQPLPFGW